MQMVGYPAWPRRVLYYWSKVYAGQLEAGDDYELLTPTISVCFVNSVVFPRVLGYHTHFRLVESEHGIAFTDDIQIHVIELPKFRKSRNQLATPLDDWTYLLRHAPTMDSDDLPPSMNRPEIRQAVDALMMLAQSDIEREFYEDRLKAQRDERARLQHAQSQGFDRGFGKGRREGHQLGLREGRQEGALMGRIETLQLILGQEQTPRPQLEGMSIEELERLSDELLRQARS